jgi:hypothetical protein
MLNRVLSWQKGQAVDFLLKQTGRDLADLRKDSMKSTNQGEIEPRTTISSSNEAAFVELINPLALEAVAEMLSPGIPEEGKEVLPTTDIGDFALKLDSVVVPAIFNNLAIFPEIGDIESQLATSVEYTVSNCSLTDMGTNPTASSVFSVLSGPRSIARVEFDPLVKKALSPFIAKGASISPTYCAYDSEEEKSSLLLLFGLPKLPEIKDLLAEAKSLIDLHTGSSAIKEHWFMRSKGANREVLVQAVSDLENLFGYSISNE